MHERQTVMVVVVVVLDSVHPAGRQTYPAVLCVVAVVAHVWQRHS
jgi:hypothetical protein